VQFKFLVTDRYSEFVLLTPVAHIIILDQQNCTPNKYQEDRGVICLLGFECEKPVTVARKGILILMKCSEEHGKMVLQNT